MAYVRKLALVFLQAYLVLFAPAAFSSDEDLDEQSAIEEDEDDLDAPIDDTFSL